MPKETAWQKAVRIILAQGVRFVTLGREVAFAKVCGDHGDYEVWRVDGGRWSCTCVHLGHNCSHIIAAETVHRSVLPALGKDETNGK